MLKPLPKLLPNVCWLELACVLDKSWFPKKPDVPKFVALAKLLLTPLPRVEPLAKALVCVMRLFWNWPLLEPLTILAPASPVALFIGKNPNGTAETADRAHRRTTAVFIVVPY